MIRRARALLVTLTLAAVATIVTPPPAHAFRTPFGDRVHQSIERGLAWIRAQEMDGNYFQWFTPLAGLTLMEARTSANWGAPTRGYANAGADDQGRLVRMARATIQFDPALRAAGGSFSQGTGSALMFLNQFRRTGGPNDVAAGVLVDAAIANGAAALQAAQANAETGASTPICPRGTATSSRRCTRSPASPLRSPPRPPCRGS